MEVFCDAIVLTWRNRNNEFRDNDQVVKGAGQALSTGNWYPRIDLCENVEKRAHHAVLHFYNSTVGFYRMF